MRARGVGALALALAALVPLAPAAGQPSGDPLVEIRQLLVRRAAALRDGDRAGWMAAVDPRAPASFATEQGRRFDGLRSLPVESYALVARTEDTGDLDPAEDRVLPETRQVYRLRGFDDRDAVDTLWWTYVRRDGRWYIGADADVADLGLETQRNIWDLGEVRVRPTAHFLLVSHPQQAERADALAAIAEDAMEALRPRWDHPWSERIPLIVPGSVEELETILQATFDLDNFVAFVVYGTLRDDGFAATAPRIYIQDRNLSRYPRDYQVRTLVHELVHAASIPLAGPSIPNWVHEGLADWIANGRRAEPRPEGSDGRLPRDFEFSIGSGRSIVLAYDESRSAVSALGRVAGAGAPSAFLRVAGEAKGAVGSVRYLTDRALERVAGFDVAGLESRWGRR